ncbi:MAG: hypothetical protein QM610_14740 [Chitinophagaceae bacterium]
MYNGIVHVSVVRVQVFIGQVGLLPKSILSIDFVVVPEEFQQRRVGQVWSGLGFGSGRLLAKVGLFDFFRRDGFLPVKKVAVLLRNQETDFFNERIVRMGFDVFCRQAFFSGVLFSGVGLLCFRETSEASPLTVIGA